jgi:peptidoglycan/xylan/chitin deacetylase (PgdA/CDA1 family)
VSFKAMPAPASKIDVREISKNLWCSREDIRHLKNTGHVIGLHSHTHPTDLKALQPELQRKEYADNQSLLVELIGDSISTMSHPCNSYNDDTLFILRNLGIDLGFRSNLEEGFPSPLEYPRLDHALLVDHIRS